MVSQKKQALKQKLQDNLAKANSFVLVDYSGLTVPQQEELRQKVRLVGAEFTVTKNTLLKLALAEVKNLPSQLAENEALEGPTATLFAFKDGLQAIKALVQFSQEAELMKIKLGFFDGQIINAEAVMELSKIPGKDELVAKLVYLLKSPLDNLDRALNFDLRKLVFILGQIKKEGGEN